MRLNRTWQKRFARSGSTGGAAIRVIAIGLGALAGLHMLWGILFGAPTNVVDPARIVVNKAAVVSSFTQDFVSTWLTATSQDAGSLAQFVTVPDDLRLPPTPAVVITAPTVVAVTAQGNAGKNHDAELYSVVVGVTERPYESAPPTRALYRVPVIWSTFGPRAASLPARVAGPGPGADLPINYPAKLSPTDPAYQTVSGFLAAYLTDSADVNRWVTSDSHLVGLGGVYQHQLDDSGHPIPLVTVVAATEHPADKPANGQTVQIIAKVHVVTADYAPVEMVYPLTLRGVGGSWSVAGIDRVPVMSNNDLAPVVTATASK